MPLPEKERLFVEVVLVHEVAELCDVISAETPNFEENPVERDIPAGRSRKRKNSLEWLLTMPTQTSGDRLVVKVVVAMTSSRVLCSCS
jgi:hypothetical protein